MAQALKEPVFLVSRYISSSPRRSGNKIISSASSTKRQKSTGTSKVLAALENFDCGAPSEDLESDIEILGPFPSTVIQNRNCSMKGKTSECVEGKSKATANTESKLKSVHPLFMQPKLSVGPLEDARVEWLAEQMAPKISDSKAAPKSQVEKATVKKAGNAATMRAPKPSSSSSPPVQTEELPLYSYKDYTKPKPALVYTKHEDETNDLIDGLKPGPLAFDIEWRVFFTKKAASSVASTVERRAAVVQLADTNGLILVIQVYDMSRFPKNLQALIENPKVPKMGANILNDGAKLFRDYGILAKGLVELGALALFVDPAGAKEKRKIVSLAKLTARYCQKALNKGKARTGNWEAELGSVQLEYAGNDVHCTMMIYQKLVEIAEERDVGFNIFDPEFSSEVLINHGPPETPLLSTQVSEDSSPKTPSTRSSVNQGPGVNNGDGVKMSPQHLRAYRSWHDQGMSIEKMCLVLSTKGRVAEGVVGEPLKVGTVISYVISALQFDPQLPFEMMKLRDLVQSDGRSWVRHRDWILKTWAEGRGVQD